MAAPAIASAATTASSDAATNAGPAGLWMLAGGVLAGALMIVAALAGAALARSRQSQALGLARAELRSLRHLLDGWHWQTDATHRLTRLDAPAGAVPATAWSADAPGPLLWEHFCAGVAEPALRARLQAQAPLDDLWLEGASPGAAVPGGWQLRGVPRFDAAGAFAGHLGVARQQNAQAATARADQAALLALLDTLPAPVWLADAGRAGGGPRVRRANPAAQRLAGAPHTGDALDDVVRRALPAALQRCIAALAPGASATEGRFSVHRAEWPGDGEGAAPGALLALLPRDDGAVADDAGHDAAAFSYTVSHDLRAPIRVVEGFTRILKEDYGRLLDRVGNDHLDRVLGAAARMHNMIDALLALARLSSQPLARQPVNLSQLAGFVVDDLKRNEPAHRVDVHLQPGLMAHGDPTLLRVVLENLLGNAWKYSAKSSRPAIALEYVGDDDGRTAFVVRDNGAGFDMRFADRLFGVFQRLHSANDFPGTGIGLASVRRIVRRHGGDVWAEAEVGQGARFYFTLG